MKFSPFIYAGFFAFSAPGCGGSGDDGGGPASPTGPGTVSGTVMGVGFTIIASAWWIGKPGMGSPPTQVYLSDAALDCAALATPGWDKLLGDKQLLELGLTGSAPQSYRIGTDANAAYVGPGGNYNPSSDGGTITVTASNASKNIAGSFDLAFQADAVKGTFDAAYCDAGVEP